MLIGLVRDSVLQCFCHTCRAPVLPAVNRRGVPTKKPNKTRTKQPKSSKKVKFITTEIRCQEKSKGGLSYEVILAEPSITVPPVQKLAVTPGKFNVSVEEIEEKLKAAEERRLSLEEKKKIEWTAKMAKIEEASRKKDELEQEFISQTKKVLTEKMEHYEEKRVEQICDKMEKLKTHAQEIEKNRLSLEKQKSEELMNQLEEKLKNAASLRDDNIKKILDRLKEHERRAEVVRQNKATLANQNEEEHITASSG
uniref:Putative stathmin n=1 Tax=Corethrella appendiculata TaxID=1370023 RepID=U5ET39_9DIPT